MHYSREGSLEDFLRDERATVNDFPVVATRSEPLEVIVKPAVLGTLQIIVRCRVKIIGALWKNQVTVSRRGFYYPFGFHIRLGILVVPPPPS